MMSRPKWATRVSLTSEDPTAIVRGGIEPASRGIAHVGALARSGFPIDVFTVLRRLGLTLMPREAPPRSLIGSLLMEPLAWTYLSRQNL